MKLIKRILDCIFWKRSFDKEKFNSAFPEGSLFVTYLKNQKFPYGKWIYLGADVKGAHVYERIK